MTFFGEYGIERTIEFPLFGLNDDGISTAECVLGDVKISKDGATFENSENLFINLGSWIYSITFTSSEMTAKQIKVSIIDQSGAVWKDIGFIIRTNKNL